MRRALLMGALLLLGRPLPACSAESAAEKLIDSGHWKRARALLESLARQGPEDASLADLMSRVRLAFGDFDRALAEAEKAVTLDANSARYRFQLARVCGEMADRSGAFKQLSLARRFRREAEAAVRLDPSDLEALMGLVEYYIRAPRLIGGDREKASRMAAEIARLDASQGYLARKLLLRGKLDVTQEEALDLKAAEADPKSYEIQLLLSDLYASEARRDDVRSEKHARAALGLDPGRAGAYVNLARQFARERRFSDLDALLSAAETNLPDDLSPGYFAGEALLAAGTDLPRAERYFREYVAQEPEPTAPDLALGHTRLALVLEKEGRSRDAIAELEVALRLRPDLPQARQELKQLR